MRPSLQDRRVPPGIRHFPDSSGIQRPQGFRNVVEHVSKPYATWVCVGGNRMKKVLVKGAYIQWDCYHFEIEEVGVHADQTFRNDRN